jgi:NOL1/NOP2/fmu family ribosome biogenesis protein
MDERFGMSFHIFEDYLLFKKKKTFWFMKGSDLISNVSHLKIKRLGIKAFQEVGSFMKPTTRMIQYFGSLATKAVLNLENDHLKILLEGEYLSVDMGLENGYVILSYCEQILGLGLLIDGKVRSQLPVKDVRFMKIGV